MIGRGGMALLRSAYAPIVDLFVCIGRFDYGCGFCAASSAATASARRSAACGERCTSLRLRNAASIHANVPVATEIGCCQCIHCVLARLRCANARLVAGLFGTIRGIAVVLTQQYFDNVLNTQFHSTVQCEQAQLVLAASFRRQRRESESERDEQRVARARTVLARLGPRCNTKQMSIRALSLLALLFVLIAVAMIAVGSVWKIEWFLNYFFLARRHCSLT